MLLTVNQAQWPSDPVIDKKWFVMNNTNGKDGKPIGKVSSYFKYRKNAIIAMSILCKQKEYTNLYDLSEKDYSILVSER